MTCLAATPHCRRQPGGQEGSSNHPDIEYKYIVNTHISFYFRVQTSSKPPLLRSPHYATLKSAGVWCASDQQLAFTFATPVSPREPGTSYRPAETGLLVTAPPLILSAYCVHRTLDTGHESSPHCKHWTVWLQQTAGDSAVLLCRYLDM